MRSQSSTLLKSCEWPTAGNEQGCTWPPVPLRWAALAWPRVASRQGHWGSRQVEGRPWAHAAGRPGEAAPHPCVIRGTPGFGAARQDSASVWSSRNSLLALTFPHAPSGRHTHNPFRTRQQLCSNVQLFIKDVVPLSFFPRQFIFAAVAHGDRLLGINSAHQGGGGAHSVF